MKPFQRSLFTVAVAFLSLGAIARPQETRAAIAPGDRLHDPIPSVEAKRPAPESSAADANFNGLYVYTTPGAPPRWVRLQQTGNAVWGTIDVNSNFAMCSRTRLDGTVSGTSVSFTAGLASMSCPCGGTGASISFLGTIDGSNSITGQWSNTCGGHDVWAACQNASGLQSACTTLPENEPPVAIARVPGLPWWAAWMLGLSLAALAVAAMRSARIPEPSNR